MINANDDDEHKASLVVDRRNSHTPSVHQQDVGYEWNDDHETLLKKWKDRSDHYIHLHSLAGKQFSKFHSWLGLPTKVLLSLIASIEFSQLSNESNSGWTFYFNGVVALTALALEAAQDYLGLAPRASKHYSASNIYEKLAMSIEMEMCNPREKRVNVRAFLRRAKATLQNLKETAPDVPERILEAYLKELEQSERDQVSQYVRNVPGGLPVKGVKATAALSPLSPPLSSPPLQQLPPLLSSLPLLSSPPLSSSPPLQQLPPLSSSPPPQLPPPLAQLSTVVVISNVDSDPETDLQDEFASAMQQKLQEKKNRMEHLQLQHFNESGNT